MVLSSGADSSSVRAINAWPKASRAPQRLIDAAQSLASTRSPLWNSSPSRSVSFQVLPSFSTTWPATICGVHLKPNCLPV